jgi:hypothetical protein
MIEKYSQEDLIGHLGSPGWRLNSEHPDRTVTGTLGEVVTESHSRKTGGEQPGKVEQIETAIELGMFEIEQLWQHLGLPTI